jgi:uncharacterized membrane protein YobD (UPF0266 family)
VVEPVEGRTETTLEQKPQWRLAGIIFFGLFALLLLYAAFMIIWPFITAILIGAIAAASEVTARCSPIARLFASSGLNRSKIVNCPSTKPALAIAPILVMPPSAQMR